MASDDRPVYVRLREVIADAILEGRYRDGDPLPSVRGLAAEYGANPLTVAKAYQRDCCDRYASVSSRTSGRAFARRSSGWTSSGTSCSISLKARGRAGRSHR